MGTIEKMNVDIWKTLLESEIKLFKPSQLYNKVFLSGSDEEKRLSHTTSYELNVNTNSFG